MGELRILLAEDNAINQRLAIRLLERAGHSVMAVSNGRAAVEAAARERFDLVLMDIHMPEMDGVEATRRIRAMERPSGAHLPVIAMTASAMLDDRELCVAAGMDSFLTNPISAADLLAGLNACFARA